MMFEKKNLLENLEKNGVLLDAKKRRGDVCFVKNVCVMMSWA